MDRGIRSRRAYLQLPVGAVHKRAAQRRAGIPELRSEASVCGAPQAGVVCVCLMCRATAVNRVTFLCVLCEILYFL